VPRLRALARRGPVALGRRQLVQLGRCADGGPAVAYSMSHLMLWAISRTRGIIRSGFRVCGWISGYGFVGMVSLVVLARRQVLQQNGTMRSSHSTFTRGAFLLA
jgi:hypothetical protein